MPKCFALTTWSGSHCIHSNGPQELAPLKEMLVAEWQIPHMPWNLDPVKIKALSVNVALDKRLQVF